MRYHPRTTTRPVKAKLKLTRKPLTPAEIEAAHIARYLAIAHCTAIDMALHDGIAWELMSADEQRKWRKIKALKDEIVKMYTAGMPEMELDKIDDFAAQLYSASSNCIHREHPDTTPDFNG